MLSSEELAVYELAFNVGITVHELMERMPYDEFLGWMAYFERRPVGWRDDERTMRLLQAQGVKQRPEEIFPSLAAVRESPPAAAGVLDMRNFRSSVMFSKMISATGGDKLDIWSKLQG
jgi:hypothetical protein